MSTIRVCDLCAIEINGKFECRFIDIVSILTEERSFTFPDFFREFNPQHEFCEECYKNLMTEMEAAFIKAFRRISEYFPCSKYHTHYKSGAYDVFPC